MDKQETIDTCIEMICSQYPSTALIYLFGSYGTEYQRNNSDIDLAFYAEQSISTIDTWNLAQTIANKINRDVDLIHLNNASTVFAYEIIMNGSCILSQDKQKQGVVENLLMGKYLRFNEERSEILDALKETSWTTL